MNIKRILGSVFVILSFVIVLIEIRFTGGVIGALRVNSINVFAIILFIIGLIILFSSTTLEKRVSVFKSGKKEATHMESSYSMTDPKLDFGSSGVVSLLEFRRAYEKIKDDPELDILIKEDYGSQLVEIAKEKEDSEEGEIAREFLEVLYGEEIPGLDLEEGQVVSSKDRKKISDAFKGGWNGRPNNSQARILSEYGFGFSHHGAHGKIYRLDNPHENFETSASPSDTDTGKIYGKNIVRILNGRSRGNRRN